MFYMNHKYTLKKNHEIKQLVNKPTRSVGSKYYVVYSQDSKSTKVAISVSKKFGTAVFRNYQKRMTREILRRNFDLLREKKILVVVKVPSVGLSFDMKEKELKRLLQSIERI